MFQRRTFKFKGAGFRKAKPETIEEFLARGGKIRKIPQPSLRDIWDKWVKRESFEQ